jgi:hypothetical protein
VPRILILALATLAACSKSDGGQPAKDDVPPPPVHHGGVDPSKFDCTTIAPVADVTTALGGTVRPIDSDMPTPRNIAKPCSYLVTHADAGAQEGWTFDMDCRPGYDKRAETLFAQYAQNVGDQQSAYQAQVGSGKAPTNDAGVAMHAPGDAHAVDVGKKALDHHGQGLLFIDDDAPCYVRVVGPDAAHRLALAQLIAKNLHEANAPIGIP